VSTVASKTRMGLPAWALESSKKLRVRVAQSAVLRTCTIYFFASGPWAISARTQKMRSISASIFASKMRMSGKPRSRCIQAELEPMTFGTLGFG